MTAVVRDVCGRSRRRLTDMSTIPSGTRLHRSQSGPAMNRPALFIALFINIAALADGRATAEKKEGTS